MTGFLASLNSSVIVFLCKPNLIVKTVAIELGILNVMEIIGSQGGGGRMGAR